MKEEYEKLKENCTPREVIEFLSKYGGSYEGAKLGSELVDKVNSQKE